MRYKEFAPEQLDEELPRWAKGVAAAGGLAAAALGGNALLNRPSSTPDAVQQVQQQEPEKAAVHKDHALSPLDYMQQTLWGESRADETGMKAIGHVILNRAKINDESVKEVVLKRNQFTCWNHNDPNYKRAQLMRKLDEFVQMKTSPVKGRTFEQWYAHLMNTGDGLDYRQWRVARTISKKLLAGEIKDPTQGATGYHKKGQHYLWDKGMQRAIEIGNHIFFRPKPKVDKGHKV